MTMLRDLAVGVLLALAAGSCGDVEAPLVGVIPLDGPLPAAVADRTALPACGFERPGMAGPWNEPARRCFVDAAAAGRPAEFATRLTTVEGDPIQFVYRVLGPGSLEVFVDATKDSWGSGRWEWYRCPHLAIVPNDRPTPNFGVDESCVMEPLP
jgi:hypothetical protein